MSSSNQLPQQRASAHGVPPCTCDASGEQPECPIHGYEAVIQQLDAERDRLALRVLDLEDALRLIAAERRTDGSWNRDREACRQLAQGTLDEQ